MARPKITLTQENQDDLSPKLDNKTNKAIQYKGSWDILHDKYWKYYLAKPSSQTKQWPFVGACPFMSPMVTVAVDTITSLQYDAMLSGRPQLIATDTINDTQIQLLDDFFFEFVWKKVVSLERLGDSWNFETNLDGTAVVDYRWNKDLTVIRTDKVKADIRTKKTTRVVNGVEIELDEIVGFDSTTTEIARAERAERPIINVLDMARLFIAPGTKRSLDMEGSLQYPTCPWYFIESYKSREQARAMREQGWEGLEEEDIDSLLGEVKATQREETQSEKEELAVSDPRKVFFRVYFQRMILPGDVTWPDGEVKSQKYDDPKGIPEEVIIWYLPKTKVISMIMPLSRMYPDNRRPHIENHHTTVGNFFFSLGIPALLENVMKLDTSATRQLVDRGTLVNKPWAFYSPAKTGLLPSLQSIAPGAMIAVDDPKGVQIANFSSNHDFWQLIRVIAQEWQERITNVTDFVGGRNAALPNSPRTLGGQQIMLGQSNIAFAHRISLRVLAYRTLFRRIASLYMHNAPEELEFDVFNQGTGNVSSKTMPKELLQHAKDFTFRLNPNRQQESEMAQRRLALVQNMIFLAQDPEALRNSMADVYSAEGKLDDFNNRIWPEEKIAVQQQQLAAQQAAAQGQPPPPPQPPQPQLPSTPQEVIGPPEPEDTEDETAGDLAVNL